MRRLFLSAAYVALIGVSGAAEADGFRRASTLPDLSGLVWAGDRFVAVHDAKAADEPGRPRVSQLLLPVDLDGARWKPQTVTWRGRKSNDLESASTIPGKATSIHTVKLAATWDRRGTGSDQRKS